MGSLSPVLASPETGDELNASPTALLDLVRDREVFRFLESWRSAGAASKVFTSVDVAVPEQASASPSEHDSSSGHATTARGCDDTALAAFAQLGALRLNAQRSFIVLFGREHEYLLAESTRTLSLQSDRTHSHRDELWIGTANYPRAHGFANQVFPEWDKVAGPRRPDPRPDHYYTDGKTPHWMVVSDLRQRQGPLQKLLPMHNRDIRFIVAVPLVGHLGCVIGAYIVLDDVPRYGINERELVFLEDMANTAVNHLASKRGLWQKKLAERLIQGLGVFSRGGNSLRDWWLEKLDSDQKQTRRQEQDQAAHAVSRDKQADDEMGATFLAEGQDVAVEAENHKHQSPSASTHQDTEGTKARATAVRFKGPIFDLKIATQKVFARASNVMREAMDMDGVVFLDAGFAQLDVSKSRRRSGALSNESTSTSDLSSDQGTPSTPWSKNVSMVARPDAMCTPLAFSTKIGSSLRGFRMPDKYRTLPQTKMIDLLKRYPEGKVFNFSFEGLSQPGSGSDFADPTKRPSSIASSGKRMRGKRKSALLRKICDDAGSVAFIPLWDPQRESWRAVALIYTTTSGRSMTREDLLYLTSFGSCVSGEIIKLDTLAADHAKATFMSCVSHELRSPLHGVLAGAEFLLDSNNLGHAQREMATTVQLAGTTLLDTVNTILDYSRINAFASRKTNGAAGPADSDEEDQLVDLALLTENIVNAATAEQRYQASVQESALINPSSADSAINRDKVQVVLDIAPQRSWTVAIAPAQWARLVRIVIGNALKFTPTGYVRVHLDRTENRVTLAIKDTGCGISSAFQEHHLFVPFRQEDPTTPGTGLGLYIARQLADSLDGTVKISSARERTSGTEVVIEIPIDGQNDVVDRQPVGFDAVPALRKSDGAPLSVAVVMSRRNGDDRNRNTDDDSRTRDETVLSTLLSICKNWYGISPRIYETVDERRTEVDVWLMLESDFFFWLNRQSDRIIDSPSQPRVLVMTEQLGPSAARLQCEQESGLDCFLDAPFGPRRLGHALLRTYQGKEGTGYFTGKWKERVKRGSVGSAGSPSSPQGKFIRPAMRPGVSVITPSLSLRQVGRRQKILLVEDNALNMRILVAWATKLNRSFEQATNGLEAVELFKANPSYFGLVLMDISMPIMDGFAATREIREFERRSGLRRCPIAAVTGVASRDARDEATAVGVDVFISKPATFPQIRTLVEEMED